MVAKTLEKTRTEKPPALSLWTVPSSRWIGSIILLGLGLRLAQYATDRSLWCDEALLALNVLHRSASGLLKPLEYHQGAPIGFLLLEKVAIDLGGRGELALRAFPLAFGVIGLICFWPVASLYLSARAAPVAVSLFAFCGSLIYYASEVKQYSGDASVTIILLWFLSRLARHPHSTAKLICLSLVGSVAIWISHPASFLLAGGGLTVLSVAVRDRDWGSLAKLCCVCGMWAVSVLISYQISLHALSTDHILLEFWRSYFPPEPFWPRNGLFFLVDRFFTVFSYPAQLVSVVGAATSIVGCVKLARKSRIQFSLLASPLLVTVAATFLRLYPLGGRFLLFTLPILFLFIGQGAASIAEASGRFSPIARVAVLALLFTKPVLADVQNLIHPSRPEDIKLAILHIQANERPGDVWYVYHWARYQFWYYDEVYKVQPRNVRIGVDCGTDVARYAADLDKLRGQPRVWVLFSHIWTGDGLDEESWFLQHLDRLGVRLDSYRSTGARAYLYDLSQSGDTLNSSSR
jgi:Dolichyl-phosphate-mannose-protein mannosyltransferase